MEEIYGLEWVINEKKKKNRRNHKGLRIFFCENTFRKGQKLVGVVLLLEILGKIIKGLVKV